MVSFENIFISLCNQNFSFNSYCIFTNISHFFLKKKKKNYSKILVASNSSSLHLAPFPGSVGTELSAGLGRFSDPAQFHVSHLLMEAARLKSSYSLGCVSFPELLSQINTDWVASKSRHLFSLNSGGKDSKIKASAEFWLFLDALGENPFHESVFASGVCGFVDGCCTSPLLVFSLSSLPHLCSV